MNPITHYPCSPDAERGVLCSILLMPTCIEELADLTEGHFYHPAHATIWMAMRELSAERKPIDLVTMTQYLNDRKLLDHIGGPVILADLQTFLPTAANVKEYAAIVRDKALRRAIIMAANDTARMAVESTGGAELLLNAVESRWMALRGGGPQERAMRPIMEYVMEAVENIEEAYKSRGKPTGLVTGIHDFDRMHGGLKPGNLIIIAGRPSMGKSALAMQMAVSVAKTGAPVAIFTLEMTGREICERAICTEMELDLQRIRDGYMKRNEMIKLGIHADNVGKLPIMLDETPALGIYDFRGRARRAVVNGGAKLIVVDYLQLFKGDNQRGNINRAQEVAEISMALKATAKELGVPVLAAAQLNRNADDRSTPKLSDLRESGQIEQDADVALLINRPKKDLKDEDGNNIDDGTCELVLAKQRQGPTGTILLTFDGCHTRFINRTEKFASMNPAERQY